MADLKTRLELEAEFHQLGYDLSVLHRELERLSAFSTMQEIAKLRAKQEALRKKYDGLLARSKILEPNSKPKAARKVIRQPFKPR